MEWISVEDRLPEDVGEVLVCNWNEHTDMDCTVAYYQAKRDMWHASTDMLDAFNYDGGAQINIDQDVTHWMPLPEPPK